MEPRASLEIPVGAVRHAKAGNWSRGVRGWYGVRS
jgi:hypothetical protein